MPVTRFNVAEVAEGWMKVALCPDPMEKFCQLITVRSVVSVMVSWEPDPEMTADPAITWPPVGLAPTLEMPPNALAEIANVQPRDLRAAPKKPQSPPEQVAYLVSRVFPIRPMLAYAQSKTRKY